MASAAFQDALRIGRDPNDATWLMVRYAADWAKADLQQLIYDTRRGIVELEPECWPDPAADKWLPLEPVTDNEGNQYRTDPREHLILYKLACEDEFRALQNIGGQGWISGRFNRPLGLTIDFRGWLYVADADNHRVQIIRPEDASVVAVLGAVDALGRSIPGNSGGAMSEPVHAIVDPCNCHVYVVDRSAALIHVFDQQFDYLRSLVPHSIEPPTLTPWPPGEPSIPVAVAVQDDGSLLVLDTSRPRLLHMTAQGKPLPDVAMHSLENPFQGVRSLLSHFYSQGTVIIGPLDSGTHDMRWHRVIVEADVNQGTSIKVQTYASNDNTVIVESLPWAPAQANAIPLANVEDDSTEFQRPVLSDTQRWSRYRHGPYLRAKPVLKTFQGEGPSSSDSFQLSAAIAARLRIGDLLEFDTGTVTESLNISNIDTQEVVFSARGTARVYAVGAKLYLFERGGQSMPGSPRLLHELVSGESVDLSSTAIDGTLQDAIFPHAVAAFFRPGDVFELQQGGERLRLYIERPYRGAVQITLVVPLGGNYSNSQLRLLNTPGRLVVEDLDGFDVHPVLHESITVEDQTSSEQANILLVEADYKAIWLEPASLGPLVSFDSWQQFEAGTDQATDRGRYIWLRLQLSGGKETADSADALHTPAIHSIRVLMPRLSYLSYLPATFSRRDARNDPSGALFLERFLALFEHKLTQMESVYESVSRLLSPQIADEQWLQYVSAWLGLVFDPSWPIERRRQLVLEAADLYQRRGTVSSLQRFVEIYTGRRPQVLEGFQWRPSAAMVIGRSGRVGCSLLAGESCNYRPYAHRFTLFVSLNEACEQETAEPSIRNIIESLKPAHVDYSLCFILPKIRVGLQSRVGLDTVLGDVESPPFQLGQGRVPLSQRVHPVIGLDRVQGTVSSSARISRPAQIVQGCIRCDKGLALK